LIALITSVPFGENETAASSPPNPCSEPLTYRIGSIDSRYNITREELKEVIREVENIWESQMGTDLFNYRENGNISVHLIYSEKQKLTEEEQKFSNRIESKGEQIESIKNEYERLKDTYSQQKKELQSMISHYEEVVRNYKSYIESIQRSGGIPRSKKMEVESRQREIKALESEIKDKEQTVESHRQRVNRHSEELNELIAQQNHLITDYNRRFAQSERFNQGNYIKMGDQERINILQFANRGKLKAVLAHEFGHAMGIKHVENPRSIMHELMQKQNIYNLSLTQEDIQALNEICNK